MCVRDFTKQKYLIMTVFNNLLMKQFTKLVNIILKMFIKNHFANVTNM